MELKNSIQSIINPDKKYHLLIIIALLVIITYSFTVLLTTQNIYEKHYVDMKIKVEGFRVVGINTDTDVLNFGIVPPGSTGNRVINVTNNYKKNLVVRFKSYGNFSDWITVSDNGFVLEPGGKREITIKSNVPEGASSGVYTGTLEIIFEHALW